MFLMWLCFLFDGFVIFSFLYIVIKNSKYLLIFVVCYFVFSGLYVLNFYMIVIVINFMLGVSGLRYSEIEGFVRCYRFKCGVGF